MVERGRTHQPPPRPQEAPGIGGFIVELPPQDAKETFDQKPLTFLESQCFFVLLTFREVTKKSDLFKSKIKH